MKKISLLLVLGLSLLLANGAIAYEVYLPDPEMGTSDLYASLDYIGNGSLFIEDYFRDSIEKDALIEHDGVIVTTLTEKQAKYYERIDLHAKDAKVPFIYFTGVDMTRDLYAVRIHIDGIPEGSIRTLGIAGLYLNLNPIATTADGFDLLVPSTENISLDVGAYPTADRERSTKLFRENMDISELLIGESIQINPQLSESFDWEDVTITLTKEALLRGALSSTHKAYDDEPFVLYFTDPGFDKTSMEFTTMGWKASDGKRETNYRQLKAADYQLLLDDSPDGLLAVAFYLPLSEEIDGFKYDHNVFFLSGEIGGAKYESIAYRSQTQLETPYVYTISLSKLPKDIKVRSVNTYMHSPYNPNGNIAMTAISLKDAEDSIALPRSLIEEISIVSDDILKVWLFPTTDENGQWSISISQIEAIMKETKIGKKETLDSRIHTNAGTEQEKVTVTKVKALDPIVLENLVGQPIETKASSTQENTSQNVAETTITATEPLEEQPLIDKNDTTSHEENSETTSDSFDPWEEAAKVPYVPAKYEGYDIQLANGMNADGEPLVYHYLSFPLSDGLRAAFIEKGRTDLFGFVDEDMNVIIPFEYEIVGNFVDGKACVLDQKGNYIIIDKENTALKTIGTAKKNGTESYNQMPEFKDGIIVIPTYADSDNYSNFTQIDIYNEDLRLLTSYTPPKGKYIVGFVEIESNKILAQLTPGKYWNDVSSNPIEKIEIDLTESIERLANSGSIGHIKIISNSNVRSGPSADFDQIGKVREGEVYEVIEQAVSGWYAFVMADGQMGYVSPKMVEFSGM